MMRSKTSPCKKILENFEHAKWMGRNAQAKALHDFSWEHIAHETEQVYDTLMNLSGAPKSTEQDVGYSLSSRMLQHHSHNMNANNNDPAIVRGISLLKMMKMFVATAGGDGILTWMGSEFGQIADCDMPRSGNGFNDELSRVKYDLAENKQLKFSDVEAFEACLNNAANRCGWLSDPRIEVLAQNEDDKIIVFSRGSCVFLFNFHTSREQKRYSIKLPSQLADVASLSCILDTSQESDSACTFSAADRLTVQRGKVTVASLPSRSALGLIPLGLVQLIVAGPGMVA